LSDLDDLLKDDEEMVSFIPESSPAQKNARSDVEYDTPGSQNSDFDDLRAQLKQQAEEIAALRTVPKVQTHYQTPVQAQIPTSAPNRAQLKEQLQNAYLTDPAEAMLNLFDMAKKEAIEEARRSMVPVAGQTTRFAIEQFRKSQNLLQDESEEFDALISQISDSDMANANPAVLSKQLEILKHAARGAALEKRTSKPQVRVPMYSVSDAVPRSASGNKAVNVKLTKSQKAFWDMGIENGLKPAQIMEVINGDDGQGGIA
jgi:peptidoglycan hydrolase-like protein with peptidoglycan-binding domain